MTDWWSSDPIAKPTKSALDPRSRELAVRTVLGEAASEPDEGMAGVAAVIRNRVDAGRYGGNDVARVVTARNQFEPWNTQEGRSRMFAYSPDSEPYKRAAAAVDRAFGEERYDPTGGMTHFYSPTAQAALGRQPPSWAQGEGSPIGRHTFYAPEGRVQVAAAQPAQAANWWSNDPVAPQGAERSPESQVPTLPDTGGRFTDTAGANFRTAREGVSNPAEPPDTFVNRVAQMWENPPKDRLSLIGMAKQLYSAARNLGEAAAGNSDALSASGQVADPALIGSAATVAMGAPMRAAPGGMLAAPVTPKVIEQAAPKVAEAVAPTAQALKQAAREGFESAPIKELEIAPRALGDFAGIMRTRLNEAGLDDVLASKTFGLLSKLEKAPADAIVTGQNLQTLRRTFAEAAGSVDKTERRAAKAVVDAIDEFIPNIAAKDILSGDPKAAAKAWELARGNYAAAMRSEDIARAVLKAQRQADAAGSGANIDNATRQQFKAILNNEKKLRGFNEEEIAQMEAIVKGTMAGNAARLVGKAAPTGIVSGALSGGAGFAVGGPAGGVLLPLMGAIGKRIGDRSTTNQVAKLDELVRSRAPLAKSMQDVEAKVLAIQESGQNARTLSALSLSARNLANNLKDAGITISPTEIMRSLQGPIAGRAEGDQ